MSKSLIDQTRRRILMAGAALGLTGAASAALAAGPDYAASPFRKISDADWRKRLPAESFDVLRRGGTEYPNTSPLLNEHRKGTFVCLGCELPLFSSAWKFDSGTGWPSFFRAMDGAVILKPDFAIGYERTEYHCARCLGHQGHRFDDGPRPTGWRYCNNGVALKFVPA
jgi:peptide-methionine (R)-S-oxide reductase